MPEPESSSTQLPPTGDAEDVRVSVAKEQAHVIKRVVDTQHVTVRTGFREEQVTVRDEVRRERIEVTRVAVDREVAEAPAIRTEGDVTIVPVLEERLVVEKRLFLVEEVHVRRSTDLEIVDLPTILRRTHVEVERTDLQQEKH